MLVPTSNFSIKPARHLINILKTTRDHHPNFVLFLGAGASVTSGVPTGRSLIQSWRKQYIEVFSDQTDGTVETAKAVLEKEPWFNTGEEYSRLFEGLFDQPSQRREYIESKLINAHPSWGYIYLVNLLKNDVFNTVFTTNFDDLINEACYQFSSNTRPIVCAHDSSIRYVRLTSKRPKIIKIHGDFLFDNIKNTVSELETLEENTKAKFRQYASEFGFIFLGYAGADKSVMDSLQTILRSSESFPHGIYWCVRDPSELSQQVNDMARNGKITIVKIDGFDEFCADLHEGLGLEIQDELSDPYGCVAKRLNTLLDSARIPEAKTHPLIKRDMSQLADNVKSALSSRDETSASVSQTTSGGNIRKQRQNVPVPAYMLAQVAERNGDFKEALKYAKKAISGPKPAKAYELAFRAAGQLNLSQELDELINSVKTAPNIEEEAGLFNNYAIDLIKTKHYDQAAELLDIGWQVSEGANGFDPEYYKINKAQIYRHKNEPIPDELAVELHEILCGSKNPYARFGAALVLGDFDSVIAQVPLLLKKGSHSVDSLLTWPIMNLLNGDERTKVLATIQDSYKLRPIGE